MSTVCENIVHFFVCDYFSTINNVDFNFFVCYLIIKVLI